MSDDPQPTPASPHARPLPRVIAVANQKGGVGKTTTSVNLGACLAEMGYRTLIVDLDPQGNASSGVGVDPRALETTMFDVIIDDVPLEDCYEGTAVRNLYIAPSNIHLADVEINLINKFARESVLAKALEPVLDEFDFVIIDCAPSFGLLTVNALVAAKEVLVPIQCEYYALEGVDGLLSFVDRIRRSVNPDLEISTVLCTMFDAKTKLSKEVLESVRDFFGEKVCDTVIPRNVRLSEAPSQQQPINVYDPSSKGAVAYRLVAKEVAGGIPPRSAR